MKKTKEKNNEKKPPEKYWFKKKTYGLGWQPATIEGWLVTIGFIVWVAWLAIVYKGFEAALLIVLSVAFLIYIIMQKAPKLEWSWGRKKTEEN